MDETLEQLADQIKDREYRELFPNTDIEKIKDDKSKVKEALFQVHYMVYNKKLYEKIHSQDENYHVPVPVLRELCGAEDFARVEKLLKGATLIQDDNGETLVPKTDLKDVLKPRKELLD